MGTTPSKPPTSTPPHPYQHARTYAEQSRINSEWTSMWMGGDVVTEEQKRRCFFETKTGTTEAEFQVRLHGPPPQPAWKKILSNGLAYVGDIVDGLTRAKQKREEERQKAMRENLEKTREHERRQKEEDRKF